MRATHKLIVTFGRKKALDMFERYVELYPERANNHDELAAEILELMAPQLERRNQRCGTQAEEV